jgi:hypothetical protein
VGWKLTVRSGSRVKRTRFADLAGALNALEARGRELASSADDQVVDAKIRRFEPEQVVIARLELAGPERFVPSVRVGIDVHGDGSVKAYRGRVRREIVTAQGGESAYAALRRILSER